MRTLGIIALTVVLLIGGAVLWYMLAYPTYTYRYRMTVEVLVDGGVRSGSSVIEVKINKQPELGSAPPQVSRAQGEAVFVDLGNGRNVIGILAAGPTAGDFDYTTNVVRKVFGLTFNDQDLMKLANLTGSRDLQTNNLPTFVTFSDVNDLKTARVALPYDFEKEFGSDVRFKRVWIEMTKDAVTRGIESRLPWITQMKANGLGGRIVYRPGQFTINVPYFVRD